MNSNTQQLLITELAPSENDGKDWIEVFVMSSGNYSGWKLYEGKDVIKTFPDVTFSYGDFIIININTQGDDETQKIGNYWDFYSTYGKYGLTASDSVISLRDSNDKWIDAVGYSNRDGDISSEGLEKYNEMKKNNMWKEGPYPGINADVQYAVVDWSKADKGKSIRRIKNPKGLPHDSNSLSDWEFSSAQTKGYGYKEIGSYTEIIKTLQPNPFSPYNNEQATIFFNIPDSEAVKTIKIFNVKGEEVITLLNQDVTLAGDANLYKGIPTGSITWDGKDNNSKIVPVGIYIIFIEANNFSQKKTYTGKTTVVVGRKFE